MENECQCKNPMIGKGRQGQRHWLKTSRENSDSIATIKDTDVVFYGDSITEGWKGTSYGFDNGRKAGNIQVFESLFSTKRGGKYEGVAMGISGDRVSSFFCYICMILYTFANHVSWHTFGIITKTMF